MPKRAQCVGDRLTYTCHKYYCHYSKCKRLDGFNILDSQVHKTPNVPLRAFCCSATFQLIMYKIPRDLPVA